ncbi:hypothetical protein HYQ45_016734 [Verticillium longisporum]|uniref:Uncharacterized protein n=1 Tax=Verticillium longisporum TaxID=100787 RepID=A0A8I2Z7S4_VERLO|nr:hypothetical protein HYQ45_016734 [Verticillium longisporum]
MSSHDLLPTYAAVASAPSASASELAIAASALNLHTACVQPTIEVISMVSVAEKLIKGIMAKMQNIIQTTFGNEDVSVLAHFETAVTSLGAPNDFLALEEAAAALQAKQQLMYEGLFANDKALAVTVGSHLSSDQIEALRDTKLVADLSSLSIDAPIVVAPSSPPLASPSALLSLGSSAPSSPRVRCRLDPTDDVVSRLGTLPAPSTDVASIVFPPPSAPCLGTLPVVAAPHPSSCLGTLPVACPASPVSAPVSIPGHIETAFLGMLPTPALPSLTTEAFGMLPDDLPSLPSDSVPASPVGHRDEAQKQRELQVYEEQQRLQQQEQEEQQQLLNKQHMQLWFEEQTARQAQKLLDQQQQQREQQLLEEQQQLLEQQQQLLEQQQQQELQQQQKQQEEEEQAALLEAAILEAFEQDAQEEADRWEATRQQGGQQQQQQIPEDSGIFSFVMPAPNGEPISFPESAAAVHGLSGTLEPRATYEFDFAMAVSGAPPFFGSEQAGPAPGEALPPPPSPCLFPPPPSPSPLGPGGSFDFTMSVPGAPPFFGSEQAGPVFGGVSLPLQPPSPVSVPVPAPAAAESASAADDNDEEEGEEGSDDDSDSSEDDRPPDEVIRVSTYKNLIKLLNGTLDSKRFRWDGNHDGVDRLGDKSAVWEPEMRQFVIADWLAECTHEIGEDETADDVLFRVMSKVGHILLTEVLEPHSQPRDGPTVRGETVGKEVAQMLRPWANSLRSWKLARLDLIKAFKLAAEFREVLDAMVEQAQIEFRPVDIDDPGQARSVYDMYADFEGRPLFPNMIRLEPDEEIVEAWGWYVASGV